MLIPLRVLLVEDSEDDAQLVLRALTQGGYEPTHQRVDTAAAMKQALGEAEWDVVLSDYAMPGFSGAEALELAQGSGKDVPLIVVSGAIGEETAVALMKAGAHDYVMKDRLTRLAPAVARELAEAESRRSRRAAESGLRRSEEQYRALAESAHDYIFIVEPDGRIRYANTTTAAELGMEPGELVGKTIHELFPKAVADRQWHNVKAVFETGNPLYVQNLTVFPRRELWLDTWLAPIRDEQGTVQAVVGISRNVTELIQIQLALRMSEERYRLLFEHAPIGIYRTTPDGRILMANPALIRMMGYGSFYELSLRNLGAEGFEPTYDRKQFQESIEREGQVRGLESQWVRRDGSVLYVRENARLTRDEAGKTVYYEGTVEDITDRHRIQDRLYRLNALLRAFRSIGQLVIREKDPGRLIQQSCNILVQARGYQYAWIALFQPMTLDASRSTHDAGQRSVSSARRNASSVERFRVACHAGFDDEFPELVRRLQAGDLTPAVRQALDSSGAIILPPDPRPLPPDPGTLSSSQGLIARLEHDQRVYGVLSVALAPGLAPDAEEQTLFAEIAADLAYALHALGLDQELKTSSQKLTQSEARYREIFERALDVIYVSDLEGRILTVNPAGQRLLGYTLDELRNFNMADLVHPDSLAVTRQSMQDKIQGKADQTHYQLLVRTKTGQTRRVEVVSRLVAEDGEPVALQGHARDVTRQHEIQVALAQSEQRYRSLVELSPDAIVVHAQGKIVYANPAALRLAGADTQDQLVGRNLLDLVHPDSRELVTQRVKTMLNQGRQVPLAEEKFIRLDGTTIDVEVAAMPITFEDPTGPQPAILVAFRDVTRRKQSEVALRQSEARYRLLFEATPIGIAVFHPDGAVLAVNQFMQDLTGFEYSDFKQLGIGAIFLDPDERNQLLAPDGGLGKPAAAGPGGIRDWETRLRRKDGSVCFALLNVDRLEFAGASILLASARDITDRKNAEERLLRLNRLYSVLSQANQAFVRERDTARLCKEACRILVEAGGYGLAWVGIVDHDARELKPIAVSGDEGGFLSGLRFPLDRPGTRGPTMEALKKGHAVVRTDLDDAPPGMPVHAEMKERGHHSVAAFPLRIGDEAVGTLTIYAVKPGHFDDEQVRLLEALAADLSFALQAVQLEQVREAGGPKRGRR